MINPKRKRLSSSYYYEEYSNDEKKSSLIALIASLIYLIVFALFMFFITLERPISMSEDYESMMANRSIVISFGDDAMGWGEARRGGGAQELLTDENSDVMMESGDGVAQEAQAINSRALYPGTSNSTNSSNQGANQERGATSSNEGDPESNKGNSDELVGEYNLDGRKLIGDLPLPRYDADAYGRVIINITVNEEGLVTTARLENVGSTTNNSILIDAARQAALKARFSPSENFLASGTITYLFRMR